MKTQSKETIEKLNLTKRIVDRAQNELSEAVDGFSLTMDLSSIPDLERLLTAPKFDFAHDIFGIIRHMDRSSYPGKLMGFFSPRCGRVSKDATV
jgi:hypothetical protein